MRAMAKLIQDAGVKPELEVFELGHLEQAKALAAEGLISGTPFVQICLGAQGGAPAFRPEQCWGCAIVCQRPARGAPSALAPNLFPW